MQRLTLLRCNRARGERVRGRPRKGINMKAFFRVFLICALVISTAWNGLVVMQDRWMVSAIADARESKRSELVEGGAAQSKIDQALVDVERSIKLINQWEKAELKDHVAATSVALVQAFIVAIFIYLFFFRKAYRKTLLGIIVAVSLVPIFWRTYMLGTDARGLVVIATAGPREVTFNPYSQNGFLISPSLAARIFISHPELYRECGLFSEALGVCATPIVSYIGSSLDSSANDEVIDRLFEMLEAAIKRGASVTEIRNGLPLIHEAILFNSPRYAALLMRYCADLSQRIDRPSSPVDGYDAIAFLNYLDQRGDRDFTKVRAVIETRTDQCSQNHHMSQLGS
ncbi:MAG: hypothetical protein V7756_00305 [Halopseudomonas sp.]